MTPTPDLGVDQPVSSVAREALREAVEAMGPETAWNDLSADQQALVLRWLATPAGPEERGEGLRKPITDDPDYFPSTDYEQGYADGRAATPAPDTGAEERLRAALEPFREALSDLLSAYHGEQGHPDPTASCPEPRCQRSVAVLRAALHDSASSGTRNGD